VFIGIALLVIITSLSIQGTSEKILNEEYIAQGKQILGELSNKSKLALLYHSIDSAKDASTAILAFPGITSIRIYNADHSSLYSNDPILVSLDSWPHTGVVINDKENSWQFTTAVYNSTSKSPFEDEQTAELVGYVSLVMSKDKMKEVEETLLINNLTISLLIASILLLCLNTITKHAARPIERLASAMSHADNGDLSIRSKEQGPIDIVNMEKAFNSMMNTLETREKELERARDSALASANAKGEFAAAVSHELRTPMNGVMGMLQLLSQEISDNKRAEYLKIAMSSSQSLLALIDDILDFSKFESGHIQPKQRSAKFANCLKYKLSENTYH
jgi:signal transduction histidine kinase